MILGNKLYVADCFTTVFKASINVQQNMVHLYDLKYIVNIIFFLEIYFFNEWI